MDKLIPYSLAMIILPIMSYFVANHFLVSYTSSHWANIYSAIVAVLVIHCLLFSFVYQAYNEDQDRTKQKEEKED